MLGAVVQGGRNVWKVAGVLDSIELGLELLSIYGEWAWDVWKVAGVLDSIELGLELLSIYGEWAWTRRQLDALFLPMMARLSSASQHKSANDDSDVAVARVMLGIMGNMQTCDD